MIKLIASDLDGTLVQDDNTISVYAQSCLTNFMKKGILFLPCSGRGYADMRSAFPSELEFDAISSKIT